MIITLPSPDQPFTRLSSASGLFFEINRNASIRRVGCEPVIINLYTGTELEGGLCQFYLRRHEAGRIRAVTPLLGPQSPAAFICSDSGWQGQGLWEGVAFSLKCVLAETATAWFWHIRLTNTGPEPLTLDVIHTQDVGLADYGAIRLNEYYVSQYVDCTPLWHERHGQVLAFRQNQPVAGQHPWLLLGSLGRAGGFVSDALQFHGLAVRAGHPPALLEQPLFPRQRHQHEHTLAVLAETPLTLSPGASVDSGFQACYQAHHPAASQVTDRVWLDPLQALPEARPPATRPLSLTPPVTTRFSPARLLPCLAPGEADLQTLFGHEWQQVEREQDQILSFFTGSSHVVLKAKELRVLRPHGHILRTGSSLMPDEAALTSTVWMNGVFNALLTQGHVSINRLFSTPRSYLSLFRSQGQRIFVELDDGYYLLDVPSAFEMMPNACRWYYQWAEGLIVVSNQAGWTSHSLELRVEVRAGKPRRFLFCQSLALNGDDGAWPKPVAWSRDGSGLVFHTLPDTELGGRFPQGRFRMDISPAALIERVMDDQPLFADQHSRDLPFVTVELAATRQVNCRITGALVTASPLASSPWITAAQFWQAHTAYCTGIADPVYGHRVAALQTIQPWFIHNALIHFLSPRGLEQFSGGGWGVRDVTQGPVEMLLALGHPAPVRDLLLRVFAAQNQDGDWPQWFMFFERERHIRPGDSHGDIVFWPVLATARYLLASGDVSLLQQTVPFYQPATADQAEVATVAAHIERAFTVMARRRIPDTRLAAYGHGDWNDSLQPVDPDLRESLCSTWTVTLHHQTLTTLARAYRYLGQAAESLALEAEAALIRADFRKYLLVDGLLTGFARFENLTRIDYLVHPRDTRTGLRYSVLPMIHAILAGLLTTEEVSRHLALIDETLKGPDGVRLFDQPSPYRGGPQQYFQRAESAAFFGREIGLMYTHAHLRYAEALAYVGQPRAFFEALCLAVPINVREHLRQAGLRQANCYYSSSDAAFTDRYQASAEYGRIAEGTVILEGGWRIYSSGAGIAIRLIRECWLGLREDAEGLVIDPVMPTSLDGLSVTLVCQGHPLTLTYRVGIRGYAPEKLILNGTLLDFERLPHPYRIGGVRVDLQAIERCRNGRNDRLDITLG